MDDKQKIETVSRVLRDRRNVIRESLNVYKCGKCEGTHAGKKILICPDKKCLGPMRFWKRIPQSKVEEITSRRAARQCPRCMKMFYVWVEECPYCHNPTLKGKLVNKDRDLLAKVYEHRIIK